MTSRALNAIVMTLVFCNSVELPSLPSFQHKSASGLGHTA